MSEAVVFRRFAREGYAVKPKLAGSLVGRKFASIKMDAERHSHKRQLLLKISPPQL